MEIQAGKNIFTPGSGISAGKQLLELLQNTPGVMVDPNENILMSGRQGVLVYIDGRNTQLSGNDLASLLKTIPADNVKSIEIIASPGARYDAGGNAGILNILLKKSIYKGSNGQASAHFIQSRHARTQLNVSIFHRQRRYSFFAQGNAEKGLQYVQSVSRRETSQRNYYQVHEERDAFRSHSFRAGADLKVNEKHSFGWLFTSNGHLTRTEADGSTAVMQPAMPVAIVYNQMESPYRRSFNNANLHWALKKKDGFALNTDLDMGWFRYRLGNLLSGLRENATSLLNNDSEVKIRLATAKTDLEWTSGKLQWKAGGKSALAQSNSYVLARHQVLGQYKADTGLSNTFIYREWIQALYINACYKKGKWQYEAGIRAEYSRTTGLSTDLKENRMTAPDTGYLNLFPSVSIQFQAAPIHSFQFSAGRRIDRPLYQEQNPFLLVLDAYNRETGNAGLRPQYTTNLSMGYTYKWRHSLQLSFSTTRLLKEQLTLQIDSLTYQTPQNAGTRKMISLQLGSSAEIKSWWSLYLNLSPFYQQYQLRYQGFGQSLHQQVQGLGLNGYMNHNFTIGKGWSSEFSGWYNFQNRNTQYRTKALGSLSAGLKKQWLSGKWQCRITVNDLLNTQRWSQQAVSPGLQAYTRRKWESQNVSIGLSLRFGNKYIKSGEARNLGNDEEVQRIRQ